jgi:5-phospho-D-xylono-1,4-lactonase
VTAVSSLPTLATVAGAPLRTDAAVRLDAHAHAWIDPPAGVDAASSFRLNDHTAQAAALTEFARAAAPRRAALLDCQPPGCGRDARALARLSQASGVAIAAVTGFHLARYYPGGVRPWPGARGADHAFARELERGLVELPQRRAAAIKAAHSGREGDDQPWWDAVIEARARTDALLLVHTERGAGAERLLAHLTERGVPARRVYLCHVDKRPDPTLHAELAAGGALLGYDTFLRPAYDPDRTTWTLVQAMLDAGHAGALAFGLDLADPAMWPADRGPRGTGFGPAALVTAVEPRLRTLGAGDADIDAVLGANLVRRAARPVPAPDAGRGSDQEP